MASRAAASRRSPRTRPVPCWARPTPSRGGWRTRARAPSPPCRRRRALAGPEPGVARRPVERIAATRATTRDRSPIPSAPCGAPCDTPATARRSSAYPDARAPPAITASSAASSRSSRRRRSQSHASGLTQCTASARLATTCARRRAGGRARARGGERYRAARRSRTTTPPARGRSAKRHLIPRAHRAQVSRTSARTPSAPAARSIASDQAAAGLARRTTAAARTSPPTRRATTRRAPIAQTAKASARASTARRDAPAEGAGEGSSEGDSTAGPSTGGIPRRLFPGPTGARPGRRCATWAPPPRRPA